MDDGLRQKLAGEVDEAAWRDLAPHQARGGLLLCDPRCDLVEVGVALALDDVQRISGWLNAGAVRKPGDAEAQAFPPERRFRFLIVQPFVVATPAGEGDGAP